MYQKQNVTFHNIPNRQNDTEENYKPFHNFCCIVLTSVNGICNVNCVKIFATNQPHLFIRLFVGSVYMQKVVIDLYPSKTFVLLPSNK